MITIIDLGIGNVKSISNILKRVGVETEITNSPEVIANAEKLIFPGVGSFDAGMESLQSLKLIDVLNQRVLIDNIPILGICLGMQLFSKSSEEGSMNGLAWLDAEVKRFDFSKLEESYKIPHMGWNYVQPENKHDIFMDIPDPMKFYFAHSFHFECNVENNVLATANHGYKFTCAIVRNNILGVQFHPEKSHKYGMQLFKNFAEKI